MELILWRHADAEHSVPDLQRRLTGKGRKQAQRVALWLKPRLEGDWLILSSPAQRACETAQALDLKFDVREALSPDATADSLLREVQWPKGKRNVLVVGHQPTLGQVAAQLLEMREGDITMKKGAIWWLAVKESEPAGEVALRAVISPDLAEAE